MRSQTKLQRPELATPEDKLMQEVSGAILIVIVNLGKKRQSFIHLGDHFRADNHEFIYETLNALVCKARAFAVAS